MLYTNQTSLTDESQVVNLWIHLNGEAMLTDFVCIYATRFSFRKNLVKGADVKFFVGTFSKIKLFIGYKVSEDNSTRPATRNLQQKH
jgi:hypothetical protein